jgi:acyl-CoA synthetase (AMP-forming)/AMP-acid ligase II
VKTTRDNELAASMARARDAMRAPGSYFEIADEDVRGTTMPVFRHRDRSLRQLLERSTRFPERTYLVEGGLRLDFGTHLELVDALASSLRDEFGIAPGDRVALFAANRWEWVVSFWAAASAGAIPCTYNGFWTFDEAAHASAVVEPALIIGDAPRLERIQPMAHLPRLLDLDDVGAIARSRRGQVPPPVGVAEDDPAVLIFTSGTTGPSKAVATPHRSLCGSEQVNAYAEMLAAAAIMGNPVPQAGDPLPGRDDVVLVTSPLFHTSMLYGVILRGVVRGTAAVLLPGRFDPRRVLEAIEKERVTSWLALGNAAPRVCALAGREKYDTSSLTHVGVGGAPVSPTTQEAIVQTFPQVKARLTIGYSSTEAVSVVASLAGGQLIEHPTSTGRTSVTVQLQVRDTDGNAVPDGDLGEVHVRSPYIMLGYWNDAAATAAVLKPHGWLAMGDLGRVRDGLLYIDTRARDMILVNAENVSPTEVEHTLEAHPHVDEAAAFAVDDPETGDAVCAVVVADGVLSVKELEAWCRTRLARYKVPTRWHVVGDPLPRTASGKLLKDEIKDLVGARGETE